MDTPIGDGGQDGAMRPCVVVAYRGMAETDPEFLLLQEAGCEIVTHGSFRSDAAARDLARCRGLIVGLQIIDDAQLSRMPDCRVVSRLGVGYDNIDLDAATARGVQVTYVPDYGMHEVSTHAITLLLAMARNLESLLAASARGQWDYRAMGTMERIQDQTLGVMGFGRIGRLTALKGQGLGMRVVVHDPVIARASIEAEGFEAVDMDSLFRQSDYISLHVPSSPATRHLIDAAAMAKMKDSVRLINTARGPLIDEEALYRALEAGSVDQAALDVFAEEPPPAAHPLLHHPRVIVTPHAAWYSEAAKVDMRVRCAQDVVHVLAGRKPIYPLNEV